MINSGRPFRFPHFIFLFYLYIFSFSGCDLFTGTTDNDLLKKIDEEVAWANAARLNISVICPPAWGSSPQNGTGRCFDARRTGEAPRLGYAFNLEFTPEADYALTEWRAYATASLTPGWQFDSNPAALLEGPAVLVAVFNNVDPNGSISGIIIDSTTAVTMVPFCLEAPRIVRTYPSMQSPDDYYPENQSIMLYFAAPIDGSTAIFDENNITITMKNLENGNPVENDQLADINKYYKEPVWDPIRRIIIIEAQAQDGNEPEDEPKNYEITVTVGSGITNMNGASLTKTVEFSWKTGGNPIVTVDQWDASYDGISEITVTWKLSSDDDSANVYYYVNSGTVRQNAIMAPEKGKAFIGNIQPLNTGGVRSAQPVSGIQRYDIYIELSGGGYEDMRLKGPLTIWNIPGMKVKPDNTVLLGNYNINTALVAEDSKEKNFVLAEDITISGTWAPVGDNTKLFEGNFYGNGHTITLNSGLNTAKKAYAGLFGYAQGAEIRDLRVVYAGAAIIPDATVPAEGLMARGWESPAGVPYNAFYAGGIAGCMIDTKVRNVITDSLSSAVFSVTPSAYSAVWLGGIAGYIEGAGIVENCYAGLPVTCKPGSSGNANVGGVAGEVRQGGIDGVTIAANVSADIGANEGWLNIGGVAGISRSNNLRDITFKEGVVSFYRNADRVLSDACGGIVAIAYETNLENCFFAGAVESARSSGKVSNFTFLGGLIAYNFVKDAHVTINNCHVQGNIGINYANGGMFSGVVGYMIIEGETDDDEGWISTGSGSVTMTNSFFEQGIINFNGFGHTYASGFAGLINGKNNLFSNCGIYEGTLVLEVVQTGEDTFYAGGFTSDNYGEISNCFSGIDVIARYEGDSYVSIGGFAGANSFGGTISACYAAGTVRALVRNNSIKDLGVNVGGFAGSSYIGTIENCYALGDVLADKQAGATGLTVGGLVGWIGDSKISRCFSTGQVCAQNSVIGVNAGGIVGGSNDSTIECTAALGGKVASASGGGAGRIAGYADGGLSNNYAIDTMFTSNDGSYVSGLKFLEDDVDSIMGNFPEWIPSGTADNNVHGETKSISDFQSAVFWQRELGFSNTVWDFSTPAVHRGYPVLRGLSGQ
ncbi:MAG: hypothetical protein FWG99_03075 [Treponema sp.]|nr:hypothetical protein [Treponema sp.]